MNNAGMNEERITPYKKKSFASKETLLNTLLFFVFFGITAFRDYLDKKPISVDNQNYSNYLIREIGFILGMMIVIALIGFAFAYGIYKNKDRQEKIKYGLILSILISLLFLLVNIITKSPEIAQNKYNSIDGKFSIQFPETPKIEYVQVDNPQFGKLDMKCYYTPERKTQCALTYYDIDAIENWSDELLRQLLVGTRDSSLANINARLIGSSYFVFTTNSKEKYSGINYYGEYQDNHKLDCMIYGRVIFVRNRGYAYFIIVKSKETPKKIIDNYLDSFECYY